MKGEQNGRKFGYPTANTNLGDLIHPKYGVYAVKVRIDRTGDWMPGVANFGRTPTTGLRDPLLEAHIFDFVGDIYGRWIEVQMLSYLRPELNFDSLDLMVVQMGKDEIEAKRRLKAS